MIFRKAPIDPEVENYIFNPSTYCNPDGSHPKINTCIDPNDILNGKISINSNIPLEMKEKLNGQIYAFSFYKDSIPIFSGQ